MVFLTPDFGNVPELSEEELRAMRETVARALEATAEIAGRDNRNPQGLVSGGRLAREGMAVATELMGIAPVSDDEWQEISNPPHESTD